MGIKITKFLPHPIRLRRNQSMTVSMMHQIIQGSLIFHHIKIYGLTFVVLGDSSLDAPISLVIHQITHFITILSQVKLDKNIVIDNGTIFLVMYRRVWQCVNFSFNRFCVVLALIILLFASFCNFNL